MAVYGDRIYTVGESNGEVAIIARRSNGAFESGFGGGDGRVDLAIGNGKDVGMAIVALPDGRLRVLAKYDADTTGSTNNDIAVLGLNADGSYDASFGGGDGRVTFPVGRDRRRGRAHDRRRRRAASRSPAGARTPAARRTCSSRGWSPTAARRGRSTATGSARSTVRAD